MQLVHVCRVLACHAGLGGTMFARQRPPGLVLLCNIASLWPTWSYRFQTDLSCCLALASTFSPSCAQARQVLVQAETLHCNHKHVLYFLAAQFVLACILHHDLPAAAYRSIWSLYGGSAPSLPVYACSSCCQAKCCGCQSFWPARRPSMTSRSWTCLHLVTWWLGLSLQPVMQLWNT